MTSSFLAAAPALRLPAVPRARRQRPQAALSVLVLATTSAWAQTPSASDMPPYTPAEISLQETVVTAVHEHSPLQVVADPKQPRQPVPASDAADYLKSIPGFSAIRSGGSNSDPVFRGQFGSRLPILSNGQTLLGACPARMDSPSSYISPETYDVLTVVKGPQTVIWGPGASAGVVRFDRERPALDSGQVRLSASLQGGTAARSDQNIDLLAGNAEYYLRLTANHSQSKDYRDGDGQRVPSHWDKWNTDVAFGWTPDANTWLELSAGQGDGEARYGGRGMDGTQFKRESYGLRLEKKNLSERWTKLEAQLYYNRADHVMDNFSLRPFVPEGGMSMPMAANVRRTTTGMRVASTWQLGPHTEAVLGVDAMDSPHDSRSGTPMQSYRSKDWARDAKFSNQGLFAQATQHLGSEDKLVAGLRLDRAQAWRYPSKSGMGGMGGMDGMGDMGGMAGMQAMGAMDGGMPATARNHRERRALPSGFLRWERARADGSTVYAGLGHVQRFPDYWELISPSNSAADQGDAFNRLQPEKTTQLDVGASWKGADWQLWTSAYVGQVQDYLLFDYAGMASNVRNVQARTAGAELGGSYQVATGLTAQATLAYSWARNRSDGKPLPQVPPLEAKLGLDYRQGPWSAGALWRLVAAQHRYAIGQGNVVGQDLGASAGFGVLSLNAGYKISEQLRLTAGIDNVFNKTYAEHLNLAGNAGFGFPGGVRIHEPGRTLWLRGDMKF